MPDAKNTFVAIVDDLESRLIDFTDTNGFMWFLRRAGITVLLMFYYMYAVSFGVLMMMPGAAPELAELAAEAAISPDGKNVAVMMTFGFMGGVFRITRTYSRTIHRMDMPLSWYVTRPLQAAVMAIFIYFAFRAGQLVFYSGGQDATAEQVNTYTLSILAIVSGLFTEQAYISLKMISQRLTIRPPKENSE